MGCSGRSIPEVVAKTGLGFSRQMAQELSQLTSALSYEQSGSSCPTLSSNNKAQRVGTSRYAVRLRQQIREAALDQSV